MTVKFEKIKIISNPKGDLFKIISKKSKLFYKFGEIYLSEVKPNLFKGWKYHEKNTQLFTVIKGSVEFQFIKKKKHFKKTISFPANLFIIKVPSKTKYCFKCKSNTKSLILNLTDKVYD
tara:strand:- start:879 stop:1235 length:357 start_codon:yes stop_codon:yes gene_type:complete